MTPKEIAQLCAKIADDKKAKDIVVLDMKNLLGVADYFVICSAMPERHVQGIAKEIENVLREKEVYCRRPEGYTEGKWVVIDCAIVIVHIFLEERRGYYELDNLWADAPRVAWGS